MFTIEKTNVSTGQIAESKFEAINQAAELLVNSGCIKPEYIKSIKNRESVSNTYIGSGIAIPHGMQENREFINKTAISVVQYPHGVEWNGETVYTLLCIAAKSDEHIAVIRRLTHLLDDKPALETLKSTDSEEEIIAIITGLKEDIPMPAPEDIREYKEITECTVPGTIGLHARPALRLVDEAKTFKADLQVEFNNRFANGKSLASLLKLGASGGETIRLYARGEDASTMIESLSTLIESGLGEPENPEETPDLKIQWKARDSRLTINGIPGSGGIAIGTARFLQEQSFRFKESAEDTYLEKVQLSSSLETAAEQLETLYQKFMKDNGETQAAIFLAHKEFLADPSVTQKAFEWIESGKSAPWAWNQAIQSNIENLKCSGNQVMSERAADMKDIGNRVLALLTGTGQKEIKLEDDAVIYLAIDLSPSETASLDKNRIKAFCTDEGGETSHTVIAARSRGIPAVVGCAGALKDIPEGSLLIVDGSNGLIYVDPSDHDITEAEKVKKAISLEKDRQYQDRMEPAVTNDGERITVLANIGSIDDASKVIEMGGEGVGLLRSEFLFLGRQNAPDEEEQYNTYSQIIKHLQGRPLTIRTLDIGGDKKVDYLDLDAAYHSFLGVRGIRLSLEKEELFRTQIRAVYRASAHGPVQIMFPMIAQVEELCEARKICEEERNALGAEAVPLGIMIEIPSAALMADELAAEADFFSIGTNDLTQYTLAMDRLHPSLAKKADGFHPAVIKLIKQTVLAAHMADIPCSVCGGIAAKSAGACLLTGLGVNKLSVDIPSIPKIKAEIRSRNFVELYGLAKESLRSKSASQVKNLFIRGDK